VGTALTGLWVYLRRDKGVSLLADRRQRWAGEADRLGLSAEGDDYEGTWRGQPVDVNLSLSTFRLRTSLPSALRIYPLDPGGQPTYRIVAPDEHVISAVSSRAHGFLQRLPGGCWVGAGRGSIVLHIPEGAVEVNSLEAGLDLLVSVVEALEGEARADLAATVLGEPDPTRRLTMLEALDAERSDHREAAEAFLSHGDPQVRLAAAEVLGHQPTLVELAADPTSSERLALRAAQLLTPIARRQLVERLFAEGTATARLLAVEHAARAPSPAVGEALVAMVASGAVDLWTFTPDHRDDHALAEGLVKALTKAPVDGAWQVLAPLTRDVFAGAVQKRAYQSLMAQPDSPELLDALRRVRAGTQSWIHTGIGRRLARAIGEGGTAGALSVVAAEQADEGRVSIADPRPTDSPSDDAP